jgi:membrane protein DedA with SNARE-associated domain
MTLTLLALAILSAFAGYLTGNLVGYRCGEERERERWRRKHRPW